MSLDKALERARDKFSAPRVPRGKERSREGLPPHLALGSAAEDAAAAYLESAGFRIIERNAAFPAGEIDIVAAEGDELVFVEVRARSEGWLLPACLTVGPDKLKKLIRAAGMWAEKNRFGGFWRIDLVAVTVRDGVKKSVEHIRDITEGII